MNTRNVGISVELDKETNADFRSVKEDEAKNTLDDRQQDDVKAEIAQEIAKLVEFTDGHHDDVKVKQALENTKSGVLTEVTSIRFCAKKAMEVVLAEYNTRSKSRLERKEETSLKYPKLQKMDLSTEEIIQLQVSDESLKKC